MINKEHIDELISKFLSGEASPEEAMLLEDWKEEHPDNLQYYFNSEKIYAAISGTTVMEADSESAWKKVKQQISQPEKVIPLRRKSYALIAAACVIILLGLGAVISYLFKGDTEQRLVYHTGKASQQVKLTDGTEILISHYSNVTIDKDFGTKNRTLHLKGSADFSVTHREDVPFIVDAGDVFIKDIGTKFSIRSSVDTDTVYVNVDEGVVLLFDSIGSSLEIRATEKALYIRSIRKIISNKTLKNATTNLPFVNESLAEVVLKLTAVYKTAILLENKELGNCRITTQFNEENLETVLGIITETLGLSYEKTTNGYLIKGKSCQLQ